MSIFSKLHKENNGNNKNVLTFLIFYLLWSPLFFSDFTFYKEALCFIRFVLSLHALFYKKRFFFQLSISVASIFNKLSINCCLSVAYYIEILSYRDTLYFLFLSLCLGLGLYMSYLCDLFCYYHFHFHYS